MINKILAIVVLFSIFMFAQEQSAPLSLPSGLGISNQMKYSNDTKLLKEIFEDWLNLDYNSGIFTTGIRLDVFQPMDPTIPLSLGKSRYADIAFKYIKAEIGEGDEKGEITVGNYYALFGRGLILKSYEDRNVRIDNNLLGVKVAASYHGFNLVALTGMPENSDATRTDILHAVDLEYKAFQFLKAGATVASQQSPNTSASRNKYASLRLQPNLGNLDLYGEYAVRQNDDISNQYFNGTKQFIGKGIYSNASCYFGTVSLFGEYKYYDNFMFQTADQSVNFNTPPAVRKDYTYLLLNRHPSPLNQNDEQGFEGEVNWQYESESSFSLNYGVTKTLPASSLYQTQRGSSLDVRTQLKEFYTQVYHHLNSQWTAVAACGYNEELDKNTKNLTPIVEVKYFPDETNTLRCIVEHQFTTDRNTWEQYYTDAITLEYLHSPLFSVSVLSEIETTEPDPGRKIRRVWNFVQFGYKIGEHSDVSLLLGSRQAGNICIGGVCRYEPAFSGIEVKMLTRL